MASDQPYHRPTLVEAFGADSGPTATECIPEDIDFLDQYQDQAVLSVSYDTAARDKVQGLPAEVYFHLGLKEELDELYDGDPLHPGYSRIGAILELPANPRATAGERIPFAIELHTKEFGDVSWYLANVLALNGIRFSTTLVAGVAEHEAFIRTAPGPQEFKRDIERVFPFFNFLGYEYQLQQASEANLRRTTPGNLTDLTVAAGKLILTMNHVVVRRFDRSYQSVLDDNLEKIRRRIREGTVFNKSGGDAR